MNTPPLRSVPLERQMGRSEAQLGTTASVQGTCSPAFSSAASVEGDSSARGRTASTPAAGIGTVARRCARTTCGSRRGSSSWGSCAGSRSRSWFPIACSTPSRKRSTSRTWCVLRRVSATAGFASTLTRSAASGSTGSSSWPWNYERPGLLRTSGPLAPVLAGDRFGTCESACCRRFCAEPARAGVASRDPGNEPRWEGRRLEHARKANGQRKATRFRNPRHGRVSH